MPALIRRLLCIPAIRRYPTSGERYGNSTTRLLAIVEPPRDPRSSTTRLLAQVR